LLLALCAVIPTAKSSRIARAYADGSGALHIVKADGEEFAVLKEKAQIGAADIKIGDDQQTLGWLVVYPNPDPNRSWEKFYGKLVLWRDGKVLRRFSTEQVFWGWGFWQSGTQIAFHTGPLHGSGRFELHDLDTGRLVASVNEESRQTLPGWAESLDHSSMF
jgi:hypothetical protein